MSPVTHSRPIFGGNHSRTTPRGLIDGFVLRILVDEHELLDALAGIDFAGIEVAIGIGGHLVHPVELAGVRLG